MGGHFGDPDAARFLTHHCIKILRSRNSLTVPEALCGPKQDFTVMTPVSKTHKTLFDRNDGGRQ